MRYKIFISRSERCSTSLSVKTPDCAGPLANSSMDINGKRTSEIALPKTDLWLSGVTGNCCLTHSASDHLQSRSKHYNHALHSRNATSTYTIISIGSRITLKLWELFLNPKRWRKPQKKMKVEGISLKLRPAGHQKVVIWPTYMGGKYAFLMDRLFIFLNRFSYIFYNLVELQLFGAQLVSNRSLSLPLSFFCS